MIQSFDCLKDQGKFDQVKSGKFFSLLEKNHANLCEF